MWIVKESYGGGGLELVASADYHAGAGAVAATGALSHDLTIRERIPRNDPNILL